MKRTLVQIACIHIYEKELNKDYTMEEVIKLWISSGKAELFNQFYEPRKEPKQIYEEIKGIYSNI